MVQKSTEGISRYLMKKLASEVSFAIGHCGSIKPERQAIAALNKIMENHEIVRKTEDA